MKILFIIDDAKRLLNLFRLILPIPSESIPVDSILREFIGGSCFMNKKLLEIIFSNSFLK